MPFSDYRNDDKAIVYDVLLRGTDYQRQKFLSLSTSHKVSLVVLVVVFELFASVEEDTSVMFVIGDSTQFGVFPNQSPRTVVIAI